MMSRITTRRYPVHETPMPNVSSLRERREIECLLAKLDADLASAAEDSQREDIAREKAFYERLLGLADFDKGLLERLALVRRKIELQVPLNQVEADEMFNRLGMKRVNSLHLKGLSLSLLDLRNIRIENDLNIENCDIETLDIAYGSIHKGTYIQGLNSHNLSMFRTNTHDWVHVSFSTIGELDLEEAHIDEMKMSELEGQEDQGIRPRTALSLEAGVSIGHLNLRSCHLDGTLDIGHQDVVVNSWNLDDLQIEASKENILSELRISIKKKDSKLK